MASDFWTRLLAPFPREATGWCVLGLSEDGARAEVRSQLEYGAVVARLDEVAGRQGWSNSFQPVGVDGLACTLRVGEVSKSVVLPLASPDRQDAAGRAEAALVQAAEMLGMLPPGDVGATFWVDFDPEAGELLYEPEAVHESVAAPQSAEPQAPAPADKPAGQQAIDRLLERLRAEGMGLEAAKLINRYGGYGSDPETARELYAKLRAVLMDKETAVG